ncbi:DUF975 family protein [bacterium]|nr:DUF975 family protein [bacterium]
MNIFSERNKFKSAAKSQLNIESFGIYFLAIVVIVCLTLVINIVINFLVGEESIPGKILDILYRIFVLPVFYMGMVYIAVGIFRGNANFGMLLKPFSSYWRVIKLNILMGVRIFLYTLLLIIPGIILSYSYAMSNYIFEENPNLAASEILERSKEMMIGHRWELFLFHLSFIGWFLLVICTCGLALFYVGPYFAVSHVNIYNALKNEAVPASSDQTLVQQPVE